MKLNDYILELETRLSECHTDTVYADRAREAIPKLVKMVRILLEADKFSRPDGAMKPVVKMLVEEYERILS